ncbi:MAG TPA: hypothetical protein VIF62_38555 [Labilithrix sp.]|jgi:hypothetical protein
MGLRRIGLIAALAVAAAACGLGLAGTATSGAVTPDAGGDGAPGDDGSPPSVDGGLDAPADGPRTFCQTLSPTPTFCADFDTPDASANAGWDDAFSEAGSALVETSASEFVSAPRSLHVTIAQGSRAGVEKAFTVTTQLSVELDVRFVDVPDSGGVAGPLRITPPAPFPGQDFYYYAHTFDSYFQEFGDDYSLALPAPLPGTWHHVVMTFASSAGIWSVSASLDGTPGWIDHVALHQWPSTTTAWISVGLAALFAVTSGETYVDNVVVRAN